jgi:uncharacterized protein (DUF427 family)
VEEVVTQFGSNPAPGFRQHPEHSVHLQPFPKTVSIYCDTIAIARTERAILVAETNHPPVLYLPLEDVNRDRLVRSSHVTRCPFKGKATYWNVIGEDHEIDNAAWTYETPYDEMLELAGMVAFYPSKVTIEARDE